MEKTEGQKLLDLIDSDSRTLRDLERLLDLTPSYLSKRGKIAGTVKLGHKTARRAVDLFGLPLDYFINAMSPEERYMAAKQAHNVKKNIDVTAINSLISELSEATATIKEIQSRLEQVLRAAGMVLIFVLALAPVQAQVQHQSAISVGAVQAFDFAPGDRVHTSGGAGAYVGAAFYDRLTTYLRFQTRAGVTYQRQANYEGMRIGVEIAPELRLFERLYISKPLYMSFEATTQKNERESGYELGHGVALSYEALPWLRIEPYYLRSINNTVAGNYARYYGLRFSVLIGREK